MELRDGTRRTDSRNLPWNGSTRRVSTINFFENALADLLPLQFTPPGRSGFQLTASQYILAPDNYHSLVSYVSYPLPPSISRSSPPSVLPPSCPSFCPLLLFHPFPPYRPPPVTLWSSHPARLLFPPASMARYVAYFFDRRYIFY
jgi:hypothetical protein